MLRCVRIGLFLWALSSACGWSDDPTEPVRRALELRISTTGRDLDLDGYSVTVDAGSPLTVPANGSVTIPDLDPGVHTVTLDGVAGNCAPSTPAPLEVTVSGLAGGVANVEITCTLIYTLAYHGASGVELTNAAGTVHRTLLPDVVTETSSSVADPLAWSPDGRLLAVHRNIDGLNSVWLANLDEGSLSRLETFPIVALAFLPVGVWSPDGRELLIERRASSNTCPAGLGRYPLDPSQPAQIIYGVTHTPICMDGRLSDGRRGFSWPDWSPDGSEIVIHDALKTETYILSPDETNQRLLAAGVQPDWSPDGSAIAYVGPVAVYGTLRLIHPDGSDDRQLTTPGTNQTDTDPAWSPDGSKVAFVRLGHAPDSSVTSTQAYVVDRDGTNERQLAVLPVESVQPFDRLFHPTWSADGLHLAYSGGGGAYVVNVDGTGFHQLSTPFTPPVQWRP